MGVENLTRDTLERSWDLQVEGAKGLVLGLPELSRVNGVDDTAGDLEGASLANSEAATSPTGVDEVAVSIVL